MSTCIRLFSLGNTRISTVYEQNLPGRWFQMNRLRLRNNQFRFKTFRKINGSISRDFEEFFSIWERTNWKTSSCIRLFGLGNTRISTVYAQNLPGQWFQMNRFWDWETTSSNSRLREDYWSISRDFVEFFLIWERINWKMSTFNRLLVLETLESRPIMPQNLFRHWLQCDRCVWCTCGLLIEAAAWLLLDFALLPS